MRILTTRANTEQVDTLCQILFQVFSMLIPMRNGELGKWPKVRPLEMMELGRNQPGLSGSQISALCGDDMLPRVKTII